MIKAKKWLRALGLPPTNLVLPPSRSSSKTLQNPYQLSFSEKRVSRLVSKLGNLIDLIERDYYLDRDHFQLLLESHWLTTNAKGGTLVLPAWDLYIFAALKSPSVTKDPDTHKALLAVAAELRH